MIALACSGNSTQPGRHFKVKPVSALFNPAGEAANSRNTNFLNQLNQSVLVRLILAALKRAVHHAQTHQGCILLHLYCQMPFLVVVLTDGYSTGWPLGNITISWTPAQSPSWKHIHLCLKMGRSQTDLPPSEKGQALEELILILLLFVCRGKDHQPPCTQLPYSSKPLQ